MLVITYNDNRHIVIAMITRSLKNPSRVFYGETGGVRHLKSIFASFFTTMVETQRLEWIKIEKERKKEYNVVTLDEIWCRDLSWYDKSHP